jgi:hypothetical protein
MKSKSKYISYAKAKTKWIEKLILNLKKQVVFLNHHTAEMAIALDDTQFRIIDQLRALDEEWMLSDSSDPSTEEEILAFDQLHSLLEEARDLQSKVQLMLVNQRNIAFHEYAQVSVQRQLKDHDLSWKTMMC